MFLFIYSREFFYFYLYLIHLFSFTLLRTVHSQLVSITRFVDFLCKMCYNNIWITLRKISHAPFSLASQSPHFLQGGRHMQFASDFAPQILIECILVYTLSLIIAVLLKVCTPARSNRNTSKKIRKTVRRFRILSCVTNVATGVCAICFFGFAFDFPTGFGTFAIYATPVSIIIVSLLNILIANVIIRVFRIR